MTNLIEKILITSFGIFSLVLFLTFTSNFFSLITYIQQDQEELKKIETTISDIEHSIKFIENGSSNQLKIDLNVNSEINITTIDNKVQFEYKLTLENKLGSSFFNLSFIPHHYKLKIKQYHLEIYYDGKFCDIIIK